VTDDPTYNPYSELVKKKVKAKVTQNQQNPGAQTQQQQQHRQQQRQQRRQQLRTAAQNTLTNNGFVAGQNTYVYALTTRAQEAGMTVGTHLTINIADLLDRVNHVGLTPNGTARDVLRQTRYHVTVEEFDDVNDSRNPRWYSAGNQWITNGQASAFDNTNVDDLQTVKDAITEANGIMAVVRQ
jgi:hypothetical protein